MQEAQRLNIIVVGAGLGGLTAALCFARDGHRVQLFERRPTLQPKGSGIMIRPNATRYLRQWGLEADMAAISDAVAATEFIDAMTGTCFLTRKSVTHVQGNPDWGTIREEAQKVFYKHAVANGAQVRFNVTVADVSEDENTARVHLSTGETVHANVVFAADGILSRLRGNIIPDAPAPIPGWSTLYQVRVSEEQILANPATKDLLTTHNLKIWMKRGGGGYAIIRYGKSERRINGSLGIPERDGDSRLWDEDGDIDYVRNYFKDYSSTVTALLEMTKRCDRWRVAEMPDLPQWISKGGRLVLLGDSAHAMFSDAAMGYSSIVEDVGVLSYLLKEQISKGVPALTKIWQDVRQPRVNKIKDWARFNAVLHTKGSEHLGKAKGEKATMNDVQLDDVQPDMHASFRTAAFLKWAFAFDAVDDVKNYIANREEPEAKM